MPAFARRQRPRHFTHRVSGVTLIELMVTVAVIAIIAAIASPALTGWIERQRLRAATEHVLAGVSTARTEATRQSRRLFLGIQAGNSGAWAVGIGDSNSCGQSAVSNAVCTVATTIDGSVQNIPYVWSGSGDHTTISMTTNTTSVSIDPVRGVVSAAVQIALTSPSGWETQVLLSTLGRASACSPSGAANVAGLQLCP